jgi:pSer/pThr/pTyr-binding forkhead associated (FHA) protein
VIFQTLGKSPSTIGVDVRQGLIVGRRDPDAEDNPDLDLSPHLAREHGVSRQHAMLLPSNEGMYLVDMGSKNGTWVNGVYLDPGVRYPLHSNDRVEFGLLRLTVRSVSLLGKGARD